VAIVINLSNPQGSSQPFSYTADNYTALIGLAPTANLNDLAYVRNAQGTQWLPGSLGGNYYPSGIYLYNGTNWVSDRNAIVNRLNIQITTTAPLVTDDTAAGYEIGSRWIDTATDKAYECLDATNGAAVWKETTGGGGGTPATVADLNTGTDNTKFASALGLQGSKYLNQSGAKISATASGTNTYTATISPAITAYAATGRFFIKFTNANTGASTISLNGLAAKSLVKNGAAALESGDIVAGGIYILAYDGTNFQVLGISKVALPEVTEVSSNTAITRSSALLALMTGMTITPASGNYLVMANGIVQNDDNSGISYFQIFAGGVAITNSLRKIEVNTQTKNIYSSWSTMAKVTVNGSEAIEIRWTGQPGTSTAKERTMEIIKIS